MREVLIVDYDPELREEAGHVLNGGVYAVTYASDGVEALKIVKSKHFDLILIDLLMPGALNGLQILQGLQRHAPDSPLVVMSDRNGHQELETALRYGAKEVLLKPVHKELMKAVADKLTGLQQRPRTPDPEPGHETALPAATEPAGSKGTAQTGAVSGPPKAALSPEAPSRLAEPVQTAAPAAGLPLAQIENALPEGFRARIFSGIPEESLQQLMPQGELIPLRPGEEFVLDICASMAILVEGQARCWYKGLLIRILDPGDTIGEASLFSKTAASLPLVLDGTEELQLCILSRKALRSFFQNLGYSHLLHFSARVVQNLMENLEHLYEDMSQSRLDALGTMTGESDCSILEERTDSDHEWIC